MATININADNFEDDHQRQRHRAGRLLGGLVRAVQALRRRSTRRVREYEDIVFAKLDTDANQELSGQLGIEGIPTLMAFREGVLVFNQAGALPGPALKQVVDAVKGLDMDEVHAQVAELEGGAQPRVTPAFRDCRLGSLVRGSGRA